jgi:ABC-2 type transport system ATP-binding protein
MRIVLGVLEPDRGEVRWRGKPVDTGGRRRFGYMPEERGLYPKMRVRDQLVHFARLHGMSAAETVAATDGWLERLGVAERARDRVEELSLGNQQRVQLAAALVHGPELLVLDEPFSGLDPVGVDVLSAVLRDLVGTGVPVIFSSHQLELVERLSEAVAIIKDGRLVAEGPVEELRDRGRQGRQVRVAVAGADARWAEALAGRATVIESARGEVLLDVAEGFDADEILDAARPAGSVTHFSLERPTLTQLFRTAVRDEPVAA